MLIVKKKNVLIFLKVKKLRLAYSKYGDRNLAEADKRIRGKESFYNQCFVYLNDIVGTVTAQEKQYYFDEKRRLSNNEVQLISTFPLDYNFLNVAPKYLMGMSVPPVMMAQIANQIYLQWFKNAA